MAKLKDLTERFMQDPTFREEYARADEDYTVGGGDGPCPRGRELDASRPGSAYRHYAVGDCTAGGGRTFAVGQNPAPLCRSNRYAATVRV